MMVQMILHALFSYIKTISSGLAVARYTTKAVCCLTNVLFLQIVRELGICHYSQNYGLC